MKKKILNILIKNKSNYISGAEIGKTLNITRAAVNKNINKLRMQGYDIKSSTNLGYKLIGDFDILDKDEIYENLNNKHDILIFDEISSTNDYMKEHLEDFKTYTLIISNTQSEGKGRNGRSFYSPKNSGIYLSYLLRPNLHFEKSLSISALVSVAIFKTIKDLYGIETSIKWINDILYKDKKIAGILCEASLEINSATLSELIIGIGINVKENSFPIELQEIATSIEEHVNIKINRNVIIAEIINNIDYYLNNGNFMDVYRKHSYILNEEISFNYNDETLSGKVTKILDNASIIVLCNGKTINLSSGEITIRKKAS